MTVNAILYDARGHDQEVPVTAECVAKLGKDQLLWIDVSGQADSASRDMHRLLEVSDRAIARINDLCRPPYLDNYTSYFGFAVDAPDQGSDENERGIQLGFLIGERWLLTSHSRPIAYLDDFKAQDKGETLIGALSPAQLAASLLDWHLTQYFAQVASIENAVDELDETILAEGTQREILDRIVSIRGRISRLRAQLADQRPIFYGFSRPDFGLKFDDETKLAFAAVSARFDRAIDEVERTREVVIGSFDLFTSMTTQQTNDLVKALTFLTAIIGFCAAIAGLLGMNFELPVFKTGMVGFGAVTGALALISVAAVFVARWRRWI